MLDGVLPLRAGIGLIRSLVRPMQTWKCLPRIITYAGNEMIQGTELEKPVAEIKNHIQAGQANIKREIPLIYNVVDKIYDYAALVRDFVVGKTTRRLLNIDFSYMNAFLASSVINPNAALLLMLTSASIGCYLHADLDRKFERIQRKYDTCNKINQIKPEIEQAIKDAYLKNKDLFKELKDTQLIEDVNLFDAVGYSEPGVLARSSRKFNKVTFKEIDSSKLKTSWVRVYTDICRVFLQEDIIFITICSLVGKATNIAGFGMYMMAYIWRAIELKPKYDVEEKLKFEMELMGLNPSKMRAPSNDLDVIKHKLDIYQKVFSKSDISTITSKEFEKILSETEAGNKLVIKPEKPLIDYIYSVILVKGFGFTTTAAKKDYKESNHFTDHIKRQNSLSPDAARLARGA